MKNKIWIGVVAVLLVILLGVYHLSQKIEGELDTIRIGAILPLTGRFADAGNAIKVGLEFAVADLNKVSSRKYKILYYDTKSEAKNAIMGYNRLKSLDKVNMFFTTLSDNSFALKPLAIKDDSLLFCIASHSEIIKDNANLVFRPINTGVDEGKFLCDYISNTIKAKRVFLYSFNTEAGVAEEEVFKSTLPDILTGSCLYPDDNYTALRDITTPHTYKDADCIAVVGYSPSMGIVIKHLRESGYHNTIVANLGFNNPSVIAAAGEYAKDILYNDYAFPYKSEKHKEREKKAIAGFKTSFTALSYLSYSSMFIIEKIFEEGHTTTKAIGEQLSKDRQYVIDGIEFTSHSDGSITSKYEMLKIEL